MFFALMVLPFEAEAGPSILVMKDRKKGTRDIVIRLKGGGQTAKGRGKAKNTGYATTRFIKKEDLPSVDGGGPTNALFPSDAPEEDEAITVIDPPFVASASNSDAVHVRALE